MTKHFSRSLLVLWFVGKSTMLMAQAAGGTPPPTPPAANGGTAAKDTSKASPLDGLRLSLGYNLDFVDGISTNSFYGRLAMFRPSILLGDDYSNPKLWDASIHAVDAFLPPWKALGIYGGIYDDKYAGNPDSTTPEKRYYNVLSYPTDSTVTIEKFSAKRVLSQSRTNFGMFVTFPWTYFYSRLDSSMFFLTLSLLNFEGVFRTAKLTYSYNRAESDTAYNQPLSVQNTVFKALTPYTNDTSFTTYESYWGFLDLGFTYRTPNIQFFLRGTPIGYHYDPSSNAHTYYFVYFTASELKFGLRVGGEFRKDYDINDPQYTVFITKDFDFSKLASGFTLQ